MNRSLFTDEQLRQIDNAKSYWGRELENATHKLEDLHEEELLKALKKEYQRAQREIKKQVEALYFDLLENGDLTTTELYKYGRFKNLSKALNKELQALGAKEYDLVKKELEYAYRDALGTMPEAFGIADFALPNKQAIEKVVLTKWAGRNFSNSIWDNKTKMLLNLEKNIRNSIALGYSKDKAIRNIMYATGKEFANVERLVRTELMHVLNEANDQVAGAAGYTKKQWLTAQDERVCETCNALEDAVFPLGEKVFTHPRCRCTFIYLKGYDAKTTEEETLDPELDKFVKAVNINNLEGKTRKGQAKVIMDAAGLNNIPISVKAISANGYCEIGSSTGVANVSKYVLDSKDLRGKEYQIKTAFHEAYHALGNGKVTDMYTNRTGWLQIEETFAECSAHYMKAASGITKELSYSYAEKLVEMLPRLKQIDKYKDCTSITDFGKIAITDRLNGGGAEWKALYNECMSKTHDWKEYSKQYTAYISSNKESLVDKMLENMPGYNNYRSSMINDCEAAIEKILNGRSLTGNENVVMQNVLAIAMNRKGVI